MYKNNEWIEKNTGMQIKLDLQATDYEFCEYTETSSQAGTAEKQ